MKDKAHNYEIFEGRELHTGKYDNENPIHIYLVKHFIKNLVELVSKTGKRKVFEIGCGEGQNLGVLYQLGYECKGIDILPEAVRLSKDNFASRGMNVNINTGNIYMKSDLPNQDQLIICMEVLEHLEHPEQAIKNIVDVTDEYFIVSVPREPLWRILNFCRGKYMKDLGNTPGHINHWSKKDFVNFCSMYAEVIDVRTPLPWTMVLCKKTRSR